MCEKCESFGIDAIRKDVENGSIEVNSEEYLIEDGPKIWSMMLLNMALEVLHRTNTATDENIKYLEDMFDRIEAASNEEQYKIKEDLLEFMTKVTHTPDPE